MNPIAEEILMHYGMPRRSGRYPWGSGDNPYQHSGDFLSRVDELKSLGMILSILVDTFSSRISLTMPPSPKPHNTACVLS